MLDALEKKVPNVAPLLVQLHECQKNGEFATGDSGEVKSKFTQLFSEIIEIKLNVQEQELLSDLLIGLISQAEKDMRVALSERLAALDDVPLRLVLHLANDEIEIATPVLRKSKALDDLDLLYIVNSKTSAYWQVIADRESLGSAVIEALVNTKDKDTVMHLAANNNADLSETIMEMIADMARDEEDIAKPLLMREGVPNSIARKLYEFVGQELRDYVRAHYGVFSGQAAEYVDDLIIEFAEAQRPQDNARFMPTTVMIRAATKYKAMGLLNAGMMMDTLRRGQIPSFIAMFSVYTGIKAKYIHSVLQTTCPKGMAIACRAFGIQKNDFSLIYMMTNRMRSTERIINQSDFISLLNYFDRVRPEVAQRIVAREG
jgi:uncharacterized protein (DUF2336 family)